MSLFVYLLESCRPAVPKLFQPPGVFFRAAVSREAPRNILRYVLAYYARYVYGSKNNKIFISKRNNSIKRTGQILFIIQINKMKTILVTFMKN